MRNPLALEEAPPVLLVLMMHFSTMYLLVKLFLTSLARILSRAELKETTRKEIKSETKRPKSPSSPLLSLQKPSSLVDVRSFHPSSETGNTLQQQKKLTMQDATRDRGRQLSAKYASGFEFF